MTNNDVLRRIRYIFDLGDDRMISIFGSAECEVTRSEVSDWLKKEDDTAFQDLSDLQLATFLNGFINLKRGKRPGPQPKPEKRLTNNLILRKLKIALDMKDFEIIDILKLANVQVSKHEISAFFRRPDHKNYRECKDQFIRNFLKGLQVNYKKVQ